MLSEFEPCHLEISCACVGWPSRPSLAAGEAEQAPHTAGQQNNVQLWLPPLLDPLYQTICLKKVVQALIGLIWYPGDGMNQGCLRELNALEL